MPLTGVTDIPRSEEGAPVVLHVCRGNVLRVRRACAQKSMPEAKAVAKLHHTLASCQSSLSSLEQVARELSAAVTLEKVKRSERQARIDAAAEELRHLADVAWGEANAAAAKAAAAATMAQKLPRGSDAAIEAGHEARSAQQQASALRERAETASKAAEPVRSVPRQMEDKLRLPRRLLMMDKGLDCIRCDLDASLQELLHVTTMASGFLDMAERVHRARRVAARTAVFDSFTYLQASLYQYWSSIILLVLSSVVLALIDALNTLRWDGRIRTVCSLWPALNDTSVYPPPPPEPRGIMVVLKALSEVPGLILGLHVGAVIVARVLLRTLTDSLMPSCDNYLIEQRYVLGPEGGGIFINLARFETFVHQQRLLLSSHHVSSSNTDGTNKICMSADYGCTFA